MIEPFVTLAVTLTRRSYGNMLAGNLSQHSLPLCLVRSEEDTYEASLSLDADHDP
jgi:hypothetical protein